MVKILFTALNNSERTYSTMTTRENVSEALKRLRSQDRTPFLVLSV